MPSNPMAGLDSWLEAPYTNAAADEAAYERWCEANDLDPSEDHYAVFYQWQEDEYESAREDAQIARAEARKEDDMGASE